MLVHGFCFFKLVFIGPKELKASVLYIYTGICTQCPSVTRSEYVTR